MTAQSESILWINSKNYIVFYCQQVRMEYPFSVMKYSHAITKIK